MTAALRAFVEKTRNVPYSHKDIAVAPATTKATFGIARRGSTAHRINGLAVAFIDGHARYGARWLCGSGSTDALLLDDADVQGEKCLRCEERLTPVVYRCFDSAGRLLYVGCTIERSMRMRFHERDTAWWPEVAEVRCEEFSDITAAHIAEARAIATEDPAYNKRLRRVTDVAGAS
jgi:hypothetical protein